MFQSYYFIFESYVYCSLGVLRQFNCSLPFKLKIVNIHDGYGLEVLLGCWRVRGKGFGWSFSGNIEES